MSERVQDLIATFEALPNSDKWDAFAEINRRVRAIDGDLTDAAFDELAEERFANLDAEEAVRADG